MRFKNVDNPKTERLEIRVTAEEKADLKQRADACLMSVSEFLLKAGQGRQTHSKHDLRVINELRLIGLQLKEIYKQQQPRNATELDPVMAAIIQSIVKIGEESRIKL